MRTDLPGAATPPGNKMPTGIGGFDQITGGGLPRQRTTLLVGGPGSGKTIFSLQTLVNGIRVNGEPGIFVAFEENSDQIAQNAESLGWDLASLRKDELFFLDAHLEPETVGTGTFELTGMLAALQLKAKEMGAKRIIFDSVDVLLTLMSDPAAERRELYRLHKWLLQSGLTGILTSKAYPAGSYQSQPFHFLPFMADCVVLLHHRMMERVSQREVSVLKYRGSSFAENGFPFTLGKAGMTVLGVELAREFEPEAFTDRVSTGVSGLDEMLGEGYYRGSTALISGAPGTAKSTLSGAFAVAACKRGEKILFYSFDGSGSEIVRNLASVDLDLSSFLKSGLLRIEAAYVDTKSPIEHLVAITSLVDEFKPQHLVIDPLSSLVTFPGKVNGVDVAQQIVRFTKARGITLLCTSLLDHNASEVESTAMNVSTLADTWIHLSYNVRAGERNRALTVIKSRGTKHSNQVRELLLSNLGLDLTEVYPCDGEVLMGTARWEKETAEKSEAAQICNELEGKRRKLSQSQAEARGRRMAAEVELEILNSEVEILNKAQETALKGRAMRRDERVKVRGGGEEA